MGGLPWGKTGTCPQAPPAPATDPATGQVAGATKQHLQSMCAEMVRERRMCTASGAGLSHCRESQALTRSRMLTNEKEMCLLAHSSTEWEDRPTQGSHRKFQTHFVILS